MAHQTEIVVNGTVTEVTEFDHTAQEIDDSVDRAMLSLLAVAAAAAYNPSGAYAVGDYCTNDGNLYKCNTPIESGEEWNAAHWTATSVAAELAEVRASLSNKAEKTPPQIYDLPLSDGVKAASQCIYWKNQFNEVTVMCDCTVQQETSNIAFAMLPEGFRPAVRIIFDASMNSTETGRVGGRSIDVFPDGQLNFYSPYTTSDYRFWVSCKFIAMN